MNLTATPPSDSEFVGWTGDIVSSDNPLAVTVTGVDKTINAVFNLVKHNGVVIHENAELPKATTAAPVKEGPEPGPVYLQDHGNPVRFRNIWVVEKK